MASVAPEISVLARDQAFELLYRRYVKDVYHYALALLRNPADAEDVTQTTFLNAYRAYKRGEEIRKPQNWLIKIAHNVARSRYARASRRVQEVPLEDHVAQLAVPEEEKPNIEAVLRALGRLPFNQRAALVMRELEGRSYAEISDAIGVSVPAVETLIFRARRALRLRTSALRSLSIVPVPSSLSQLFGAGGVVGGASAVAGAGLLLKATVAIVAGAIATGIVSDRQSGATAAAKPAATPSVHASVPGPTAAVAVSKSRAARPHARQAGATRPANRTDATSARGEGAPGVATRESRPARRSHLPVAGGVGSSLPTTDEVVAPVTNAVATVEQAVTAELPQLPPVPAPALPVAPPSLPPTPVPLPPVGQLP
jgi:RNA polymerase sigma factor (sigma-70 family)